MLACNFYVSLLLACLNVQHSKVQADRQTASQSDCRLLQAQADADHAAAQACSTQDQLEALQKAQHERHARSDLILRTLVPLQQEIDKVSMLLLGVQGCDSADKLQF